MQPWYKPNLKSCIFFHTHNSKLKHKTAVEKQNSFVWTALIRVLFVLILRQGAIQMFQKIPIKGKELKPKLNSIVKTLVYL